MSEATMSILIITYNRAIDTLLLLRNLAAQNQYADVVKELLLLNNNSTTDYSEIENYIAQHPQLKIKYYDHDENLGVARGRNFLIPKASGKNLLVIDDDMEFEDPNAMLHLSQILDKPACITTNTQLVTFGVFYFENKERQTTAFPHKKHNSYVGKDWFSTYYFAGGAHVVRKSVFDEIGLYPTDFFYGMEEYDLSYRMIQAGIGLAYDDSVAVLHKESIAGRMPNKHKLGMLLLNKSKVAFRYLPKRYFYSTAFMWSLQYLKNTKFDFVGLSKLLGKVAQIPKTETRKPLDQKALTYLQQVEARLWY